MLANYLLLNLCEQTGNKCECSRIHDHKIERANKKQETVFKPELQ